METCWTISSQSDLNAAVAAYKSVVKARRAGDSIPLDFCAHIATPDPLFLERAEAGMRFEEPHWRGRSYAVHLEVHGGTLHMHDPGLQVSAFGLEDTVIQMHDGHLRAFEKTIVHAHGGSEITAGKHVVIYKGQYCYTTIRGGFVIPHDRDRAEGWGIPPEEWLAAYDLTPDDDGVVVVYKGVDSLFKSDRKYDYSPGSTPVAHDWWSNVGCGYGLHFSPRPFLTRRYTNYRTVLGCPVRVDEMVVLGDKIKAKRVVEPGCFLVDLHGRRINVQGKLVDAEGNLITA